MRTHLMYCLYAVTHVNHTMVISSPDLDVSRHKAQMGLVIENFTRSGSHTIVVYISLDIA
jgi:hypothetical protein